MLNDPLNDLFTAEKAEAPRTADRAPASFRSAEQLFTEGCPKCRGRGRFISYSGRDCGPCFACNGAGRKTLKTAPEVREQNRARAAELKVQAQQQLGRDISAWLEAHRAEGEWMNAAAERGFAFAVSLREALCRHGSLTNGQLEAVRKCIAKDAERAAERAERIAGAPVADTAGVDRLKAAFDKAAAYAAAKAKGLTIRNPKITIGGITISPAKATSANAGALYVKDGQTYLGKIAGGRFFASRDCGAEDQAKVLQFVADPAQAAKVYGQETGVCCVCNATLRSEWRLRGIGPICAEKFGW